MLCERLGVRCRNEEGLQGPLLHALAERLGDPDVPARTWVLNKAAPIGIERPIQPGGVFPELREADLDETEDVWYAAMLWAALAVTKASKVERKLVKRPLSWLRALCKDRLSSVGRHVRPLPPYSAVLTFDGSLTGGGAVIQFGVQSLSTIDKVPILSFMSVQWSLADLALVQVVAGDPACQARLEALVLVVAINTGLS